MRSHKTRAPIGPLLRKEIRELASGNALWVLMLLLSPLVGYSFIQAVALYAEASRPALTIPELARQLSPFDGILVPTLGGFYLAITLLFPFIAIRLVAAEKTSGGLKLLVQLPYRLTDLVTAKLAALMAAWLVSLIPVLSALISWVFRRSSGYTRNRHLVARSCALCSADRCDFMSRRRADRRRGDRRHFSTRRNPRVLGTGFCGARSRRRIEPIGCAFADLAAQTL